MESDTTFKSPTALTQSYLVNGRIVSTLPNLEEHFRLHHRERPQTHAVQLKTVLLDKNTAKYLERWKTECLSFLGNGEEANERKRSQTTEIAGNIIIVKENGKNFTTVQGKCTSVLPAHFTKWALSN